MRLVTITRNAFTEKSTGGRLDIDGVFFCYTLEPPTRPEKPCAIPNGTYPVKLLWSERFQLMTPHVMNVPDFTEIEWHPGNRPGDTEGCALIGETRDTDWVGNSIAAFTKLLLQVTDEFTVTYTGVIVTDQELAG